METRTDNPFAAESDPLADPEFELLESYLDGELTPAEVQRLEHRLVLEPELSAALDRMSAEHAVRRAVWQSMEPDDAAARRLSAAVASAARRSSLRRLVARAARVACAVAACVVLFLAGVGVGRGQAAPENPAARQDPQVEAGAANPPAAPDAAAAFFHAASNANPQAAADGGAAQVYQVALTDEDGNITAVQKFDTLEKAQSFAAEVTRWQARHEQIQNGRVLVKTSNF